MANNIDQLIARAQVGLFVLFSIGVFALLGALIFDHAEMSGASLTIITTVITSLVTILILQANYFYARHRPVSSDGNYAPPIPSPPSSPGELNASLDQNSLSPGPLPPGPAKP